MGNVVSNLLIKLAADFGAAKTAKAAVTDLDKSLGHLGKSSGGAEKVAAGIKEISAAAKGLNIGWSQKFTAEINKLALSGDKLKEVEREWKHLVSTIKKSDLHASMPKLDAWETATIASLRKVEREAAKAKKNGGAVGGDGAGGLSALALGRRVLGPIAVGYEAYRLGKEGVHATAEYQRERVRGDLAGMTPDEIKASSVQAAELSRKYKSVGQVDIMEHIRSLRGVLGDFHHAQEMIETIVQAQAVLQSGSGGKEAANRDLTQITTGLEGMGLANDPTKFARMIDAFVKGKNLFGSRLTGEDFRTYIQKAKSSKYGLSEDYLAGVVPTMLQHEGANQFGTAQATAFNALLGGRQTKASKAKLKAFGLLDKNGEVIDKGLLTSDPDQWAFKNLKSKMLAAGMSLDTKAGSAEREKAVDFLMKAFSARNTGEFFAALLANEGVINKDRHNLPNAGGTGKAGEVAEKDPFQAWQAVKEQSANLAQNIFANSTIINKGLGLLADGLAFAAHAATPEAKEAADKAYGPVTSMEDQDAEARRVLAEEDARRAEESARRKVAADKAYGPVESFEDQAAQAATAGASTGSGFKEGLAGELSAAEALVAASVARMKSMLGFSVSPTISPKVNAPAGGPEKHASISNTSRRLARRIEDRATGNFTDREFG